MIRRIMITVLLVAFFPVLASAWTLNTWVKTTGGVMTSRNMENQTSANNSVFRTYTTQAPLAVSVTANTGYNISKITLNGTDIINPASPYATTVHGPVTQTVYPSFAPKPMPISASSSAGGTVSPTSNNNFLYGQKFSMPMTFSFTPTSGYHLQTLTGAEGATVNYPVPAPDSTTVYVTYPAGYTITAPIVLYGTFVSTLPIVNAGVDQTGFIGEPVTLTASYTGGSGTAPAYFWTQQAGPATVQLTSNGNVASFTPTVAGNYTIRVTLNTGSWDLVNVNVVGSLAAAERTQCQTCHFGNSVGNPQLFYNWSSSTHKSRHVLCYNCHVGSDSGSHPGSMISRMVDESTFLYTNIYQVGTGSYCLNGTCHSPGITHKSVGMTCAVCHNSGEIHNPNATFTASLNVCFNCHGGANGTHYYSSASIPLSQCTVCHNAGGHNPAPAASVTPAHFNGYTSYVNPSYAAAYVTARTACSDCHQGGDPASATDASLKQFRVDWAASGHGDESSAAWKNSGAFNWKATGTPGAVAADNSGANDCVRCHSSLGYQKFTMNGAIAPVGELADHSSEPLVCGACHNADFSPRSLPAFTAHYNYSSALTGKQIVSRAFPDVKESNICMPCHSGRANGDTIKAIAARTAQQSYSSSFWHNVAYLDGHHLAAGAQLFGATGYQYGGQSYDSAVGHNSVALSSGAGPCVGCHMQSSTHSYKAAAGSICNSCHTSGNIATVLIETQANFSSALSALQSALTVKGFAPLLDASGNPVYPYFATVDWGGSARGPGNMGAAQNFMALKNDPGAYAHNPTYVKRLIRDSIDWLMNGSVDRSRDLAPALALLPISTAVQAATTQFLIGAANGSAACMDCHADSKDSAGNFVVTVYNASKHASVAGGPSCASCHAPGGQLAHPSAVMLTGTAEVSAKCAGCHKLHSWKSEGICTTCHNGHNPKSMTAGYPHYTNFSSAQYVTTNVSCANCHNATDENGVVTFNIYSANLQWGRSGKGNEASPAYLSYDFKTLGTPLPANPGNSAAADCVRCHTTTGYINYVTSNFQDIHAWGSSGLAPGGDRTREMVSCAACHNPTPFNSFDSWETDEWGEPLQPAFSRRVVPQVTAYYNYSGPGAPRILNSALLDDQGASNNCIACHSGTVAGSTLKKIGGKVGPAGSFWSSTPFIDPHGMAGAGVLYSRNGYTYPVTRARNYAPPNGFAHAFIDDAYWGGQGPCVACHLYTDKPHVFSPVSSSSNGTIAKITAFDYVCSECHDGSVRPVDLNNPANLNAKKQGFVSSLKALSAALGAKGIHFNPQLSPYFFTESEAGKQGAANVYTNWNALYNAGNPKLTGCDVMGAAFNLRLLWSDGGAYAHNSYYAKRLIYDSIDFLDDGTLNKTAYVAIQNLAVSDDFTQDDKNRALGYVGLRP